MQDAGIHIAQRLRHALALRPSDQRGQLEQLEVADHGVRDVEVGVEAKLAEAPARPHGALQELVPQQPVGRMKRLGGTE